MSSATDYENEISRLDRAGVALAYFRTVTWRWYLPTEERLRRQLQLRLVSDVGDGRGVSDCAAMITA